MQKAIVLDLDGTVADLYSVEYWEQQLQAECAAPYARAKVLGDPEELNRAIAMLAYLGYSIEVVSWLAKGNISNEFANAIRRNKRHWIKKHLPALAEYGNIHVVRYGTNKWRVAENKGGILLDDEERNVVQWNRHSNTGHAIQVTNDETVLEVMRELIRRELTHVCS